MGVHLNDLPPKVREQVARKMVQDTSSGAARHLPIKGAGKYHNQKAVRYVGDNAIRFDSQKEARRFDELILLLKAGKIRELKLQVDFTLQEAYTMPDTGNRVRAIRYRADFTYLERVGDDFGWVPAGDPSGGSAATSPCAGEALGWRLVVEDVKSEGTRTREYGIKRKLMAEKYGIQIREV